MRKVGGIAQQKLQGVLARRQGERGLCLARAEMQMVFVVRDWLVQRRQHRVDQKMVVAGVRLIDPGWYATPILVSPNCTVKVFDTYEPFTGEMMYTCAPGGEGWRVPGAKVCAAGSKDPTAVK